MPTIFMRNPYEGKRSSKKSVRYYTPTIGTKRDIHSRFYSHMLVEDLHLGVMPIGGRSSHPDFKVTLVAESKEVRELVSQSLAYHFGRDSDLPRAVCHFMDEAAHVLVQYGKAYYEIVYYCDNSDPKRILGFEFEHISSSSVRRFCRFHCQILPKSVVTESDHLRRRIVWLPAKDLLVFSIPRQLGGTRRVRKLISKLQWLSDWTVPKFALEDMAKQKPTSGYDFSVYKRNQNIFLARITRQLGWSARQMFDEELLEFYQVYRHFKFQKSKAILREYMLQQLNRSIEVIGRRMGFKAIIRVDGLPSSNDYDEYIHQLLAGTLSFSDAVKISRK